MTSETQSWEGMGEHITRAVVGREMDTGKYRLDKSLEYKKGDDLGSDEMN